MTAVTFQSLVIFLLSGIAVGALIDGVRFLKEKLPYKVAMHWYLIELVVWASCGGLTFYLLYNWQDGHWRWLNFLVQLCGILLYDYYIFRLIRLIVGFIVYSIITPFLILGALFWKIMLLLFYFASRVLNLFKFRRTR